MLLLVAPALLALSLTVLEHTLLSPLPLDLPAVVVAAVALEAPPVQAAAFALGVGYLADVLGGVLPGFEALLALGMLMPAWTIRRHVLLGNLPARVAAVGACLLVRGALRPVLGMVLGIGPEPSLLGLAWTAGQVAAGSLAGLPVLMLLGAARDVLAPRQPFAGSG
jgi:hypothetical protein